MVKKWRWVLTKLCQLETILLKWVDLHFFRSSFSLGLFEMLSFPPQLDRKKLLGKPCQTKNQIGHSASAQYRWILVSNRCMFLLGVFLSSKKHHLKLFLIESKYLAVMRKTWCTWQQKICMMHHQLILDAETRQKVGIYILNGILPVLSKKFSNTSWYLIPLKLSCLFSSFAVE